MKISKTPRTKKVIKDLPISMILKINDSVTEIKTDSIIKALRSLPVIRPIKTYAQFQFGYKGHVFNKLVKIPQMKLLLSNENNRLFLAKLVNMSLGIKVDNYE